MRDYMEISWKNPGKDTGVGCNFLLELLPQIVVLEKILENPLDSTEIKPVNPKGYQPWILIGRIDAEAEAPVFWPPYMKSWLIGKVPDAGKYWGQKEKMVSEDEMARWHHQSNGRELGQTSGGVRDKKACVLQSMWCGPKELEMTAMTTTWEAHPYYYSVATFSAKRLVLKWGFTS